MDWFSWLSKTSLDPSLMYEYGLVFSHNELEEDDISYLNHEFLQSMGITIAKHRLEILKLARKERKNNLPPTISRLVYAIKNTKTTFMEYIRKWVLKNESALVIVSKRTYSSRRNDYLQKKNNKKNRKVLKIARQERLLLTSGNSPMDSFSSPMGYDKMDGYDDPYWSARVEEIRWDAMFQDLKPT